MRSRVRLSAAILLGSWSWLVASEASTHVPDTGAVRANLVVTSVRITDNGDNDGFADPNETVNVYVTLRNGSGSDQDGIVVRMGSTDPTVACIPTPVISFGSLVAGEVREGAVPLVLRVANVVRTDILQDFPITLDFAVSGDDFGTTTNPQSVTLESDLNASGGFLPTTFTEGFENAGLGAFTTVTLDAGKESLALSDGFRCQYNDPDFPNSNSYGSSSCYMGGFSAAQNAYDWHVHTTASPDGGRAYLGNNSLHWGVHPGQASEDTTRLGQLDTIRITNTVNLDWNGVTSDLSFKHQVGLVDCDYISCEQRGMNIDRGIVQVQLANSAGQGVGRWRKIFPYENVYDTQTTQFYRECLFDPTDDGDDEDDYFDPSNPARRLGPSSTCYPEFSFTRLGSIRLDATFDPADIEHASDGPGLQGSLGPGTWVVSKFNLARWRGRRIRFRFLVTSLEVSDAITVTMEDVLNWNPTEADDGWYIDDVQVTNTLTSAATVSVDTADRTGLPACGPVCTSLTPSLVVTPADAACGDVFTLDASGSTADQCPGGALQFRFWWIWGALPPGPGGVLTDLNAVLLQDWSENGIISHLVQTIGANPYRVDVRCSTRPACGATPLPPNAPGVRKTVVSTVDSSCVPLFFPYSIGFESKSILSWGTPTDFQWVRGVLGLLRANGGDFDGTLEVGFGFGSGSFLEDPAVPAPGEGKYYLLRAIFPQGYRPPHLCKGYSYMTGSPDEVPGAGGNRDEDIGPGPDGCP